MLTTIRETRVTALACVLFLQARLSQRECVWKIMKCARQYYDKDVYTDENRYYTLIKTGNKDDKRVL